MKKALIVLSVIVVLSGSLIATAKPGGKPPKEEYEYTVVFSGDISSTSMTFSDGVTGSWDGKEWSAWSDHAFGDFQFPDQAVEDCQLYQLDRDLFKRGKVDNGIRWRVDILAGGDRFTCIQYESIGLVTRMLDADTWVAEFHNAELVRRFSDGTYEIISVDFQFTLTRTLK